MNAGRRISLLWTGSMTCLLALFRPASCSRNTARLLAQFTIIQLKVNPRLPGDPQRFDRYRGRDLFPYYGTVHRWKLWVGHGEGVGGGEGFVSTSGKYSV